MTKYCSECRAAQTSPDAKFCSQCGAALDSGGDLNLNIRGDVNDSQLTTAGRDVNIHYDGEMIACAVSGGSGEVEEIFICPDCNGTGIISYRSPIRRGDRYLLAEGCKTCGGYGEETSFRDRSGAESFIRKGSGQIYQTKRCEACGGQGSVRV